MSNKIIMQDKKRIKIHQAHKEQEDSFEFPAEIWLTIQTFRLGQQHLEKIQRLKALKKWSSKIKKVNEEILKDVPKYEEELHSSKRLFPRHYPHWYPKNFGKLSGKFFRGVLWWKYEQINADLLALKMWISEIKKVNEEILKDVPKYEEELHSSKKLVATRDLKRDFSYPKGFARLSGKFFRGALSWKFKEIYPELASKNPKTIFALKKVNAQLLRNVPKYEEELIPLKR